MACANTETVQSWEKEEWGLAGETQKATSGDMGQVLSTSGNSILPLEIMKSLNTPGGFISHQEPFFSKSEITNFESIYLKYKLILWKTMYSALCQNGCYFLYLVLK